MQHGTRFFKTNTQKQNKMIHQEFKTKLKMFARDIEKDEAKLNENFLYFLPWVGEDLWKLKYQKEFIQKIYNQPRQCSDEFFDEALKDEIRPILEMLRTECSRSYNVRTNSTGALHREISIWKFQCDLELIEWLNRFVK